MQAELLQDCDDKTTVLRVCGPSIIHRQVYRKPTTAKYKQEKATCTGMEALQQSQILSVSHTDKAEAFITYSYDNYTPRR